MPLGSSANTIAGRIANHFDLRGGGYTVDGACVSSLLAVADAAGEVSRELAAEGVAEVAEGAADLGAADVMEDVSEEMKRKSK